MMKAVTAIITLLWASVSLVEMAPQNSNGCDPKTFRPPHGPMHRGPLSFEQCAGKKMTFTDEQKNGMMACADKVFGNNMTTTSSESPSDKSMKPKKWPEMKVRACGMVCVGQLFNLFDADGKPISEDMTKTVVSQLFPVEMSNELAVSISACTSQYGKDLIMADSDCGSYRELLNCYLLQMSKACNADFAMF